MPTSFTELLARVRASEPGPATVEVPSDWTQGRSTFGGLPVALALERMRMQVEPTRRPRSLLVAFVGPIGPGPIEVRVEALRHGQSASVLEARVLQGQTIRCTVTGSFAADRPSEMAVEGRPRPSVPGPDGLTSMPFIEGLMPTFTQHFELRWAVGQIPFARSPMHEFGGWCRLRESGAAGPSHVAALVDAWPAPALQQLRKPGPASSMSWMLELADVDEQARSDDWWYFHADTDRAIGGWVNAHATLWSPSGKLVALSRQTVAVFA